MKRKTAALVIPAIAVSLGVAAYSRSAGGTTAAPRAAGVPSRAAAVSYARVAAAPPAPAALASNPRVQAMARLTGLDPRALRQIHAPDQPLGALLAGRNAAGDVCVAEANDDAAGSFECDVFRDGPLHLIAGSRGTPSHTTWSGFLGVVDASVRRLSVRTAGGFDYDVPINEAGGFSYGASDASLFPVELSVYAAGGRLVLSTPLPRAASPLD